VYLVFGTSWFEILARRLFFLAVFKRLLYPLQTKNAVGGEKDEIHQSL
jgi:hypothetical protein